MKLGSAAAEIDLRSSQGRAEIELGLSRDRDQDRATTFLRMRVILSPKLVIQMSISIILFNVVTYG